MQLKWRSCDSAKASYQHGIESYYQRSGKAASNRNYRLCNGEKYESQAMCRNIKYISEAQAYQQLEEARKA